MVVDARHALDALPDGVVIADEDGVVRLVNDRAAVLLGTTREATEGRPLAEVVAVTNQEGAGWVACTRPYEGLVTRTGVPEQSWILPSGDEVLVTARIHRAPGHGRGHRRRGVACDPVGPEHASTATGPTWSPPSPTSSARR